jgi:hypothetical protein
MIDQKCLWYPYNISTTYACLSCLSEGIPAYTTVHIYMPLERPRRGLGDAYRVGKGVGRVRGITRLKAV